MNIANEPALKQLIKAQVAPLKSASKTNIHEFIRLATATYFHPVGTCAIGMGDQFVVDSSLKVRGIENLKIADALLCLPLLQQTPMRRQ